MAGVVRRFIDSDHVAGIIADLVLEEQDEALAEDLDAMDAFRDRIAANDRERARLVELASKVGATDDIAAKLTALEEEAVDLRAELADMERGTPVFDRDQIEFWLHEVVGKSDPLEVIALFVKRVTLDRERGHMHVEFIFDDDYRGDGPGGCSRMVETGLSRVIGQNVCPASPSPSGRAPRNAAPTTRSRRPTWGWCPPASPSRPCGRRSRRWSCRWA